MVPVSEEDLLAKGAVSPQDVLSLQSITKSNIKCVNIQGISCIILYDHVLDYLCSPDANVYDIGKKRSCVSPLLYT